MPLHQNQDGTWQWGKSGKKYKKKQDAIKQMKAIFASGYVEKKASFKSYTDVLGMIKEAADPGAFIQSVAKKPEWNFQSLVSRPREIGNSNYNNRYWLWKLQGLDDPQLRKNTLKDAYYKTLYQRESSNNPNLLRRYKSGKVFSAGIGSVDQPALDQMKKMRLVPKNWRLADLAKNKNAPAVKKAIEGLQEKFYNKEQIGNTANKLQRLTFDRPSDTSAMYLRYNRGRGGAKQFDKNKLLLDIYENKAGLSPRVVSNVNSTQRNQKLFRKDYKKLNPALYPLVYDDRAITNSY